MAESKHFTVGTYIYQFRKGRGKILSSTAQTLTVRWEDDSVSIIRPFVLNR